MPSIMAGGRPPYVEFETRSVEDRAQTEKFGSKQYRNEDYVIVRQAGEKDTMERNAEDWLRSISQNPNYDPMWVQRFHSMYQQFKAGQEVTPNGTHVRMWGAITPAERDTLIAARILTVEDLAGANEQALRLLGMGARVLQQKARDYVKAATDTGKTVEELASLRADKEYKDTQIAELKAQMALMSAQLAALQPKTAASVDEFLTN
jgi:hypothetical protein